MNARLIERDFSSEILGNQRRVWLQPPPGGARAESLCVLLDGEYYVERMEAPADIEELQASSAVRPFAMAYVSHINGKIRWPESFCNYDFARFLALELLPWTRREFQWEGSSGDVILGGLSLTGLAAAHAAMSFPQHFPKALCQSASFWWSDCWLVSDCLQRNPLPLRFRITCGQKETQEYVEHGPELIQRTSQLASNRAMRDALASIGCNVSYDEFDGGHDLASWKRDLLVSLQALLAWPAT